MLPQQRIDEPQYDSLSLLLVRLYWMAFGPMLLVLLLVGIVQVGTGWFTGYDAAFFVVLAGLPLARFFEFSRGKAETAFGERVTSSQLWRYAATAVGIGVICWAIANLIGNHLLPR